MTMIKHILKAKGRGYVSVSPNGKVCAALEKMAEKNIGSVLVMDEGHPRWHLHRA